MSDPRIDAIRKRLENATDGTWEASTGSVAVWRPGNDLVAEWIANMGCDEYPLEQQSADAAFIAHAPDDVEWLLARVEELETALIEMYREHCEACRLAEAANERTVKLLDEIRARHALSHDAPGSHEGEAP